MAPDIRMEMLSRPRLLAVARALVGTYAQRAGFDDLTGGQISLAVDEAICNIIKHGYDGRDDGHIWLELCLEDAGGPSLRITLEDDARQVDPETIRSRDLDDIRPGGLGVYIMREVMDDVTFAKRAEGGMRLTLRKALPPNVSRPDEGGAA